VSERGLLLETNKTEKQYTTQFTIKSDHDDSNEDGDDEDN
jgi:hypothetical protein